MAIPLNLNGILLLSHRIINILQLDFITKEKMSLDFGKLSGSFKMKDNRYCVAGQEFEFW